MEVPAIVMCPVASMREPGGISVDKEEVISESPAKKLLSWKWRGIVSCKNPDVGLSVPCAFPVRVIVVVLLPAGGVGKGPTTIAGKFVTSKVVWSNS